MNGRLLHWSSVVAESDDDGSDNVDNQEITKITIPPYVAVMDEESYNAANIAKLLSYSSQYMAGDHYGTMTIDGEDAGNDSERPLRGVLVLASSTTPSENESDGDNSARNSSPEPAAPQGEDTPSGYLTVGSSHAWNDVNSNNNNNGGDGLTNVDMYGLPTAYVYDINTANYLRSVAVEQSDSLSKTAASPTSENGAQEAAYPSILAEFNYYMGPGGEVDADGKALYTSKTCLGWNDTNGDWAPQCAPLGGNSVWATAGSPLALGYAGGGDGNGNADGNGGDITIKPTILVATSIDSTSMFHNLAPGASNAASNILTVLMAAHLIGSSVKDETLDNDLYGKITFAFFQGESYGYVGSRRFIIDVVNGFTCADGDEGVPSVYKKRDDKTVTRACLEPLRADLTFQNLGSIRGMIAVDQVGNLGGAKDMYVQGGEATDGGAGFASFLSNVLVELSNGGDYTVQASSVGQQDDGTVPLPPTPLSSLVKVSASSVGGVVLSGYDDAFVANSLYHSHLDSTTSKLISIDKDAIATAATLVARAAVAAAYQNADNGVDYATAAAYALELLPDAVDSTSTIFANLYNCLLEDGNCETFLNYGGVERANDAARTGSDLGMGVPLGTPPNYYVSIYESSNGQAFVRASGKYYGSLVAGETGEDGELVKKYGEDNTDTFLVRPTLLEMSLFGLLNDFLGKGSLVASVDENNASATPSLTTCKVTSDCSSVSYCPSDSSSSLAVPTCAGGSCVCGSRSHYHPALDEALSAATNARPGRFVINDADEGISALYAEPYWSHYVGVRIYNDAGNTPGVYAASVGAVVSLVCMCIVWRVKKSMVKEKVY